jgi:sterol desaturase/sphingolipid hydroxylase (fatty acid hydroxylase superfamily)
MWEIHKVHHAAEEMNIVTPFRNHPIDHMVMTVLNAFPVAILGASPGVVISYYAINTAYQSLVHSEINLKGSLWDKIWITPAAHRIHHSNRREHWDTNFGIVTIWDRLFGTYHAPVDEKLTYGVEGAENFNQPRYLFELFDNVRRWIRLMWSGNGAKPGEDSATINSPETGNSHEHLSGNMPNWDELALGVEDGLQGHGE